SPRQPANLAFAHVRHREHAPSAVPRDAQEARAAVLTRAPARYLALTAARLRAQLWPWVPPLRSTVNDLACKCNNRNNRNNQTLFPGHRRTGLAVRAKNAPLKSLGFLPYFRTGHSLP